jgi:hypothetical protein
VSFKDYDKAARLRSVIANISAGVVDRMRPRPQYGTLVEVEETDDGPYGHVLLPGESVPVPYPLDQVGQNVGGIVRVGGVRGDRYIESGGDAVPWCDETREPTAGYDTTFVIPHGEAGSHDGSAVLLADGRVLYMWGAGTSVRYGYADSLEAFLFENGSVIEAGVLLTATMGSPSVSVYKLPNGRVQAHIAYRGTTSVKTARSVVVNSTDNGATWSAFQNIMTPYTYPDGGLNVGAVVAGYPILVGGRLVMTTTSWTAWNGSVISRMAIVTSDDGGLTWVVRYESSSAGVGAVYGSFARTICRFTDGRLFTTEELGYVNNHWRLWVSEDNGTSWSIAFERLVDSQDDERFHTAFFVDAAEPHLLKAVAFPINTNLPGRIISSSEPTSASSWQREGDYQFSRGPSPHTLLVQNIDGNNMLHWSGRLSGFGSNAVWTFWRGLLMAGPDAATQWCMRVDSNGRWHAVERESGNRTRRFAFLDEVVGGGAPAGLDALVDVSTTGLSPDDVLTFDADVGLWRPKALVVPSHNHAADYAEIEHEHDPQPPAPHAHGLDDLSDVQIGAPVSGATVALVEHPSTPGLWVPGTVEGAAGEVAVLTAPNGGKWKIGVTNMGTLTTEPFEEEPPPPEPTYADVVASLGADTYWPMGESSGDFQPEVGSTVLTAGSGLTRNTSGGPENDAFVHINGGGTLYPTAGRPTATSTWTIAFFLRVAAGSSTGWRSVVVQDGGRGLFLIDRKVRPYQMLWGTAVGPDLGDDTWHLVAVGSDGASSSAKLWVDGVLVHTGSGHGYLGLATNTQVGSNGSGEILAGDMARLAMFPTMLTDTQMADLWAAVA